jgi:hypothetical protein
MGSVSHRLLVRFTLIPRASISLHAFSIQPMRSPMLLPSAMYAVRLREASSGAPLIFVGRSMPALGLYLCGSVYLLKVSESAVRLADRENCLPPPIPLARSVWPQQHTYRTRGGSICGCFNGPNPAREKCFIFNAS